MDWRKVQSPSRASRPVWDRFWEKVDRPSFQACWAWKGAKHPFGYGMFVAEGKMMTASRLAYSLIFGELRPEQCACHKCDNPVCCNPWHMFVGTRIENNLDRDRKGRTRNGASANTKVNV